MIEFTTGNLLQANVEALTNTVNTVGVMGKGIALQFKEKFQENFKLYKRASDEHLIRTGNVFITPTNRMDGVKWIVNFPTKQHWQQPSKIEYIEGGLDDLVKQIRQLKISSIAIPPLGCGNGGLNWEEVKPIILEKMRDLKDVKILVFEPSDIAYEQKDDKNRTKAKPKLTPTRALILYLMKSYAQFEYSLTVLEIQKLVYFLKRLGDDELQKIKFDKHFYGPYAPILNHVLYDLDGFYITGMKFKDVKTFDSLEVLDNHYSEVEEYIKSHSTETQKRCIESLLFLIEGFETPLSMELLSTVDYVMKYEVDDINDLEKIVHKVQSWNERKNKLMTTEFINVAFNRLSKFSSLLYEGMEINKN